MIRRLCILFFVFLLPYLLQAQAEVYKIEVPKWKTSLRKAGEQSPEAFLQQLKNHPQPELIRIIDLRSCSLEEVPVWLQRYGNLEILILRDNPIRILPDWLADMRQLRTLSLSQLPRGKRVKTPKNQQIRLLTIADSDLKRLPRWTRRFRGLEELYLEKNQIDRIKRRLPQNLQVLDLSKNPVELLRQRAKKLDQLKGLILNSCNIKCLPTDFWTDLSQLERLQLAANQLDEFPKELLVLDKLKQLSLYRNQITSLPYSLGKLEKLQVLDLYFNELNYLPESISQLDSLEVLYVANNNLIELPESIGKLKQLKELYAHHNKLTYLPASIANLKQLEILRLNQNALQEFPEVVLQFPDLRELDLAFNQIRQVPEKVLSHPPQRELSIQENPLEEEARQRLAQLKDRVYLLNY